MGYQGTFLRHPAGPRFLRSETADYLLSPNGVFLLVQQPDGNLVIYHGTDLSNLIQPIWATNATIPANRGTYLEMQGDGNLCNYANLVPPLGRYSLWCSNTPVGQGQYLALLEDSGNFKLCRGNDPTNPGPVLWETGVRPPLTRIEMRNVKYDLDNAVITDPNIQDTEEDEYTNNSSEPQLAMVSVTFSYVETSSWEAGLGVKVGVEAEVQTGIPLLVEGKVKVGLEVSFDYKWSTTKEEGKTKTRESQTTVPPHTTLLFKGIIYTSQIIIPYTADVTYFYQSGISVSTRASGFYRGSSENGVKTSWNPVNNPPPLP